MCRQCRIEADDLVDPVVVERLIGGWPVKSNHAERELAIEHLDRIGLTTLEISDRVRVTERTVVRYRTARRAVNA